MPSRISLENLLKIIVNTPEEEKRAVILSILGALNKACGLFQQTRFSEYQETAKNIQEIIDEILQSDNRQSLDDEEWEEEFVESGSFTQPTTEETFISTNKRLSPVIEESTVDSTPASPLMGIINNWNKSSKQWLKLPKEEIEVENQESVINFANNTWVLRSNILSNAFDEQSQTVTKFDKMWENITQSLQEEGCEIITAEQPTEGSSKIIYSCRPRITEPEKELIRPKIVINGSQVQEDVWSVTLPTDSEFPTDHEDAAMPSHWRGIFGEIDILLEHIAIQGTSSCAIESVNKTKIDTLASCRENVLAEVKRRREVLKTTVNKDDESVYRLATDYWRVEECFWSIFHDDDRPNGCSYFDRLRNRLQSWRTTLRRVAKFYIRDFSCGSDSLASINQYIGNIILKPQKNVSPGIVVRELRPAMVVKDQAANRTLKGRVIAT